MAPRSLAETRRWSSFKQATRSNDPNQPLDRKHPIQVFVMVSETGASMRQPQAGLTWSFGIQNGNTHGLGALAQRPAARPFLIGDGPSPPLVALSLVR